MFLFVQTSKKSKLKKTEINVKVNLTQKFLHANEKIIDDIFTYIYFHSERKQFRVFNRIKYKSHKALLVRNNIM